MVEWKAQCGDHHIKKSHLRVKLKLPRTFRLRESKNCPELLKPAS